MRSKCDVYFIYNAPRLFQFYTVGNDEEIRPYINTCYSKYASQFGWAIYVMEGALLSFGAFLAWETRHVSSNAIHNVLKMTHIL